MANQDHGFELHFFEPHLNSATVALAESFDAVCVFVNDILNEDFIRMLYESGVRIIALRCAGFNNVDLVAAQLHGISVVRVPAYSPYAVAEHAVALILTLNRKIHRAHARVREGNFSLHGLLGFDLYQKTIGIVGTGQIGRVMTKIMHGFSCKILGYDPMPHQEYLDLGMEHVSLEEMLTTADIISLHCPLSPEAKHLINQRAISLMKPGVMLINTSRGAVHEFQMIIQGRLSSNLKLMMRSVRS